jgi:2-polyprenyl-6-methoxyphenol hydroxylase-like FAD-dependent oxidoreductase
MASTLIGRQAVVIGAGMAGLPAAGVLADFFEHVVMVERDILPLDASHRTGTPQARHTHALLAGGQRALGELFPGFEQDLAGAGAVPLSVGLDLRLERPGYDPFPARDVNLVAKAMSRPLIEFTLRQRVNQHTNITIGSIAVRKTSWPRRTAPRFLPFAWRTARAGARPSLSTWSSTPPGAPISP